jgi:uncharacterized protein (DUF1499 family)
VSVRKALTRNRAQTRPDAPDPRLRSRAYSLPFNRVWRAASEVAAALPRWSVVERDPIRGRIRAEVRSRLFGRVDDVEIAISLDPLGRTRVDLVSASRTGRADFGANARRIARFLRLLDRRLGDAPR